MRAISVLLLFIFGFSITQVSRVCVDCHDFQKVSIEEISSHSFVESSSKSETSTQDEMHICIACHCSPFNIQSEISYDFFVKIEKQNSNTLMLKSPPFLEGPFQPPRLTA